MVFDRSDQDMHKESEPLKTPEEIFAEKKLHMQGNIVATIQDLLRMKADLDYRTKENQCWAKDSNCDRQFQMGTRHVDDALRQFSDLLSSLGRM